MPIGFIHKKTKAADSLGLSLGANALAYCVTAKAGPRLLSAGVLPLEGNAALTETLARLTREQSWRGLPCHIALAADDYKLLPAETPTVPDAEINQALLWSLRDVLDTKPEDTVLESFAFASGISRPGKPARHVVTASKQRIRSIVDAVREAGLDLESIDIPELSLRNVIARLPENAPGVGLISQGARGVNVAIYRSGELYVTRQLAGIGNLDDALHSPTMPRLAEQLGLELLRTLDYYDSQLRQRPPAAVYLQPLHGEIRPLLDNLSATVNLPIKALQFANVLPGGERVSSELQAGCLGALGAALREDAA